MLKTKRAMIAASRAEIDALNREAWALRHANPSEAEAIAQRAKSLAEAEGYAVGIAESLIALSAVAYRLNHNDAAVSLANQGMDILEKLAPTATKKLTQRFCMLRSRALNTIALTHWHRCDFPNALMLAQEALALGEKAGDKAAQAMSANSIALAYREMGDFANALDYHLKCKTLAEASGDHYMRAGSLNNIGVVYRRISDFKEALAHFIESNRLYKELGNQRAEATTLGNIGTMQIQLSDPSAALMSFQTALAIHAELGAKFDQTTSLLGIARAYAAMNNLRDAETYFKKCLTLIGILGDDYAEAEARLELGKLYQKSSQKKAIAEFAKALPLAEKVQARDLAHQLHAALASSYKESGKHLKAIEHLEQAHNIEREIYNEQSDRRLKNLQTLYNLDAAERVAKLEREKRERAERDLAQRRGEILRLTTFLAEKKSTLAIHTRRRAQSAHAALDQKSQRQRTLAHRRPHRRRARRRKRLERV